jgi:ribosomal protein S18 acetylase RimI-like enzyme
MPPIAPSPKKACAIWRPTKYQGLGLGKKLMDFVEDYATRVGAREMALDTSEHAHHLISIYKNRGYRFVEYAQWDETNYRSVILSKPLGPV